MGNWFSGIQDLDCRALTDDAIEELETRVAALAQWANVAVSDIAGESEYQQSFGESPLELPGFLNYRIFPARTHGEYMQPDGRPPIRYLYNDRQFVIFRCPDEDPPSKPEWRHGEIGTISHATMRSVDLAPVFLDTLEELGNSDAAKLRKEWTDIESRLNAAEESGEYDQSAENEADDFVHDLFDALEEHSPPYCYFGANEGDGSDYGFWPHMDFERDMKDDGVEIVSDLSEIETRQIAIVNDHGNVTFGYLDSDGFHTTWSIV